MTTHRNKRAVLQLALADWLAAAANPVVRVVIDNLVSGLAVEEAVFAALCGALLRAFAQLTLAFLPLVRWLLE